MSGGLVLDASVPLAWFLGEAPSPSASLRRRIAREPLHMPALWPLEIANVLLTSERRRRLTIERSDDFAGFAAHWDLRIEVAPSIVSMPRLLELARAHGLTVYDATYLELAHRLGLPLATLDRELIAAAPAARVRILEN